MPKIDLTPFGFTPTESLVYGTLLRLGPSTGYAVARGARVARANPYGAASRATGRPVRYRPADPENLIAQLATRQGEALDRLSRDLRDAARTSDPTTREISGSRAVANLVMQLVARAEHRVDGVLAGGLWRPTLPAWRRAGERAQIQLRITGELPADPPSWMSAAAEATAWTLLVIDEAQMVVTTGEGEAIAGLWSSHPLIVGLAMRAVATSS
jgi:hypothetical protein